MTDITLLDGGMGQELVHRAGDTPTPLWGTQVMIDHPGLVEAIHHDYFVAGATIATSNTYAILRDRLDGTPFELHFAELNLAAMTEARAAAAHFPGTRVAGSIGPIKASYRTDLHPDYDVALKIYREKARMTALHADLLIGETVASILHARSILDASLETGLPVWLALTVDDQDGTRLRSGEPLAEVLPHISKASAVLINCSSPEAITPALDILKTSGLPFGAYANGFEKITEGFLEDKPTVDALNACKDLTPAAYADHVMGWIDQGATIVGGCCEVGPAHIKEIAERLRAAGHTIV